MTSIILQRGDDSEIAETIRAAARKKGSELTVSLGRWYWKPSGGDWREIDYHDLVADVMRFAGAPILGTRRVVGLTAARVRRIIALLEMLAPADNELHRRVCEGVQ